MIVLLDQAGSSICSSIKVQTIFKIKKRRKILRYIYIAVSMLNKDYFFPVSHWSCSFCSAAVGFAL